MQQGVNKVNIHKEKNEIIKTKPTCHKGQVELVGEKNN